MSENKLKLKPCPFCDGEAVITKRGGIYHVWCKNSACRLREGECYIDPTPKTKAIKAWNTRSTKSDIKQLEYKLEPCVCGEDDVIYLENDGRKYSYVECGMCGRRGALEIIPDDAIKAWNTCNIKNLCAEILELKKGTELSDKDCPIGATVSCGYWHKLQNEIKQLEAEVESMSLLLKGFAGNINKERERVNKYWRRAVDAEVLIKSRDEQVGQLKTELSELKSSFAEGCYKMDEEKGKNICHILKENNEVKKENEKLKTAICPLGQKLTETRDRVLYKTKYDELLAEVENSKNELVKTQLDCVQLREFKLFLRGDIIKLDEHNPHKSFAEELQTKMSSSPDLGRVKELKQMLFLSIDGCEALSLWYKSESVKGDLKAIAETIKQALPFIDDLFEAKSPWIRVEDGGFNDRVRYFVKLEKDLYRSRVIDIATHLNGKWWSEVSHGCTVDPTHFMSVPEISKKIPDKSLESEAKEARSCLVKGDDPIKKIVIGDKPENYYEHDLHCNASRLEKKHSYRSGCSCRKEVKE